MKMSEINELTKQDIEDLLEEKTVELENLKFQLSIHQIDNPMKIKEVKKDIARLKTVLRENELKLRELKEEE